MSKKSWPIYILTYYINSYGSRQDNLNYLGSRFLGHTVCPRNSDPFYEVPYYIKWVTTSWTYSRYSTRMEKTSFWTPLIIHTCEEKCKYGFWRIFGPWIFPNHWMKNIEILFYIRYLLLAWKEQLDLSKRYISPISYSKP